MAEYQVLARKYRPQKFSEVIGQEAIVTTLKNAIKNKRLAHAYLFCGSRGTGKTTLARVLAKALNCLQPTPEGEPCNQCQACKEITSGNSLDVLEIDGASHRGIDDIRQINDTVGYASSTGGYKIYIIDEVHMLTKEAFNALLKTLEEPPPRVMFFFATTEPHKVLPTILSRCQRFNLNRISQEKIFDKLRSISQDLGVSIEDEALHLIASTAEGGLRDAESLLDQIISFHSEAITLKSASAVLGVMTRDSLFELDRAGKEGNLAIAFDIAHQVFSEGKDLVHFVELLTEHFRNILMVKLSGKNAPFLVLSDADRNRYEETAKLYAQEQCMTILDFLIEQQGQIRFQTSGRIALETILLRILRSHQRLPIEFLVRRLSELEQSVAASASPTPIEKTPALPSRTPQPAPPSSPLEKPKMSQSPSHVSIDPTPTPADLGIKEKPAVKPTPPTDTPAAPCLPPQNQCRVDTLLQFAAVELEGTIQKKQMAKTIIR